MWNGRSKLNSFAKIAKKLGFIGKNDLEKAGDICERADQDPELTNRDLFVGEGLLTQEQAEEVSKVRIEVDPRSHVRELRERAKCALRGVRESSRKLSITSDQTSGGGIRVVDVLAAKKAQSG